MVWLDDDRRVIWILPILLSGPHRVGTRSAQQTGGEVMFRAWMEDGAMSEDMLRKIAYIVGPASAAQAALDRIENLRKAGIDGVAISFGGSIRVYEARNQQEKK
jgi:hypothetical protein